MDRRVLSQHDVAPGTRERLVLLAIAAIDGGGEASVRVRDLADAAGVSAASIYHFFDSRDGLVEAALMAIYDDWIRLSDDLIGRHLSGATTAETFRDGIREILRVDVDPGHLIIRTRRLQALGALQGRPALAEHLANAQRRYNENVVTRVCALQEQGVVRPDLDASTFGIWLTGFLTSRNLVDMFPHEVDPVLWTEMCVDAISGVALQPNPS